MFLASLRADILLLTEVLETVSVPDAAIHFTQGEMQPGRRWAAVAARSPLRAMPDPHGATAMAEIDGVVVASSILPWRDSGGAAPWIVGNTATRTTAAVDAIEAAHPVIWGGDWNHELTGRLWTGSIDGRERIEAALDKLGLAARTASAPHRNVGARSIDHVAVPGFWEIHSSERVSAIIDGFELSDHDAYVIDVDQP